MSLSTRFALAAPRVTTDVIMVSLFPYLAIRHGADDVPTTVVNGRKAAVGALGEADYLARVLGGA